MRIRSSRFTQKQPIRVHRLVAIAAVFLLVATVYLVQMLVLRISGKGTDIYTVYDGGISSVTVSVDAVRGNIYDRNGVLLVTSKTKHTMAFTYDAIPNTSEELNHSIARTADALRENGLSLPGSDFPLYGAYPDYVYYAEAEMDGSACREGLLTVLDALGLKEDATSEKLVSTMVSRYKLKRSGLTDAEIDDVIRIRYDMLKCGFGVYTPYVFVEDASDRLMTYVEELDIRGLVFTGETERVYCYPGYASHILGQIGKIPEDRLAEYTELGYPMDALVGISGCEEAFEEYLHGIDGTMVREYDEDGNLINYYYDRMPVAGNDVYLTIDIKVQVAAEDALRENIRSISESGGALSGGDADSGAVVAIDPDDFSVIALASYPTYDLSAYNVSYGDLVLDETKPLLNRALNGTYEPGSTFKIGMALAALEEGIITPSTKINDTGVYTYYPGYHPRCWIYTDTGQGHGSITVTKAIEVSCNYFFYDVGRLLGIDRMTDYMSRLGLGERTGIELPEQLGILASPTYRDENGETPWTSGDTLQAAIGQSNNLFTPLQMACYFSTVFNGGTRYNAHLLSSVNEFYTETPLYTSERAVISELDFSGETYDTLLTGISDVVSQSPTLTRYFKALKAAGVSVGGKTGTAQVSSSSSDNAIFASYADRDGDKLVAVCVIEHGSSGANAGYTVSKLMEEYYLGAGETAAE